MNISLFMLPNEDYIRAASDIQLSSSDSNLLTTLLKEEDQHDYNQLPKVQISDDIIPILSQLCSLFHLSSSALWMATILLKKLILQQHSIDLLTIVACVTLSSKYQDSSSSQPIDYQLLAHCCHFDTIQHIHDAELRILDLLSYDLCVTTPDHFFSYLSNLNNNNDDKLKQIIEQARSLLSFNSLSHQIFELLHNYPCSIVALSLMSTITSNTFIIEQMKSFIHHKKDPQHYFNQVRDCIVQLQSATS